MILPPSSTRTASPKALRFAGVARVIAANHPAYAVIFIIQNRLISVNSLQEISRRVVGIIRRLTKIIGNGFDISKHVVFGGYRDIPCMTVCIGNAKRDYAVRICIAGLFREDNDEIYSKTDFLCNFLRISQICAIIILYKFTYRR